MGMGRSHCGDPKVDLIVLAIASHDDFEEIHERTKAEVKTVLYSYHGWL